MNHNFTNSKGSKCRKCQASIFWGVTETRPDKPGRHIPLDPPVITIATDPKGVISVIDGQGKYHRGYLAPASHRGGCGVVSGRVPHHKTCPFADEFRKPKRKTSKGPGGKGKKAPISTQTSLF